MNHDEDCNPDTFGMDADDDGEELHTCCNGDRCGTDCNDTDPGVNSAAAEACNGIDDDCDGIVDEGFDCVQDSITSGPTACGTSGERRCSNACTWLDDDFYAQESAVNCNYCDDTGRGLITEAPFATESQMVYFVGDTSHHGTAGPILFGSTGFGTAGSVTQPAPVQIGHGIVVIEAEVEIVQSEDAREGWGIWVTRDPATEFVGNSARAGIPALVDGFSVSWSWPDASDNLSLGELRSSGAGRTIHFVSGGAQPVLSPGQTDPISQRLRMEITPDDPSTAADETMIRAGHVGHAFVPALSCGGVTGRTCGRRISVGDFVWFGVSSGAAVRDGATLRTVVLLSDARYQIHGLCPR